MNKINQIKKAIIIAAGPGSRLNPFTNDKPKCMLKIGDKIIMERQFEALRDCEIDDISVVRGYKKEMINFPGIKYYENTDYQNNNILKSLFYAEKEMGDAFIFSYSDILYTKDVVEKLLSTQRDINLVIDVDWAKQYENRIKHPVTEAELVQAEHNKIIRIGKNVGPQEAYGEFIGLALFSKKGAEILRKEYQRLVEKYKNRRDQRFQNADFFEKAYLTDMMQELIDRNYSVFNIDIKGNWMEIDTDEDLEKAEKQWGN